MSGYDWLLAAMLLPPLVVLLLVPFIVGRF